MSEPTPPRRQAGSRAKPELTRKYVLGIVYELISEHGIESLSMRTVAQATGFSTGTINYHFKNKHSLLIEALESAYELPPDWEAYRGTPATQLRRLAVGYVMRSSQDRFWRFWINYLALSTRDADMLAHQQERYERQEKFWARLIADGIASGELRKDLNPIKEAERLLTLTHGLLIRQLISPTNQCRNHAKRLINEHINEIENNKAE